MFFRSFLISFLSFCTGLGIFSLNACISSETRLAQLRQTEMENQKKVRAAALKDQRTAEAKLFTQLKPEELRVLVQQAVVYGYPLVLMDLSKQALNEFRHVHKVPEAGANGAHRPSVDTLASSAWVDLSQEPVVLSVPATGNRYYMMSILDGWTNVFASPGTRTSGNGAGNFALVGPRWEGQLPVNVQKIQAPTDLVLILAQTLVKGAKDDPVVQAIQNRYVLTPLSLFSRTGSPVTLKTESLVDDDTFNFRGNPADVVMTMDAQTFLARLSQLMKDNPAPAEDQAMLENLEKIGVIPGYTVDFAQLPAEVKKSLNQAVRSGFERVAELARYVPGRVMNGWVSGMEMGRYGSNYETRAAVAWMGLGAHLPEDALFPSARVDADGLPLSGANKYVLHFAKDQWPPVNAFWSLTLYNLRQGFVQNPLQRYSLGSKSPLKAGKDGSLEIYIQAENPGKEKEANWLPAPSGEFNLMLRLYWPKQAVLSGEWQVPAVQKVPSSPLRRPRLTQRTAKVADR